ncbi:MAG: DUF2169 domain-containing protein [Acidobacteria bacterium]|nr:DUF2169 domain-containing protein [Acidobacteriota bacterium]
MEVETSRFVVDPPFTFGFVPWQIRPPQDSLTVIAKGTFHLHPGEPATGEEEEGARQPVCGDLFHGGDPQRGCRYPSDFVAFKPRADLLLAGHCHPPGGEPCTSCDVTFRVGKASNTLKVFGHRWWQRQGRGWKMAEPRPFAEMELVWERAFGGPGFGRNPLGMGIAERLTPAGKKIRPLPNLEDPRDLIRSPGQLPNPASFAPQAPGWEERMRRLGTYDDKWLDERWPWFPADMDWGYFNAAPDGLQVPYLRGDEELFFGNLHPEHPRYVSRLPGLRARCFLVENLGGERRLREVEMKIDTLWVDMDAELLVLVWRGTADVLSLEHEEIERFLVVAEPLAEPPRPVDGYRERMLPTMGPGFTPDEPFEEEPEP